MKAHAHLAIIGGALGFLSAHAQVVVWNAGSDLLANEVSATEATNPNPVAPEWSYGWRTTANTTALTLFTAGDHINDASGLQGFFYSPASGPGVLVNTLGTNFVNITGPGPLGPVAPGELYLDPSFSGQFTVVRWTAPLAGDYTISANWRDIDPYGGNGAAAKLVVNGVVIFSSGILSGADTTLGAPMFMTFNAGDKVDFVVDALGDGTFDSTAFNATVTAIPEPPLAALIMGGLGLIALIRRRY